MTTVVGIAVPDSRIAREETAIVRDAASPTVFHHSRRVFFWVHCGA
ncbi:hypothetical protein [Streptomyces sp. NPDC047928]